MVYQLRKLSYMIFLTSLTSASASGVSENIAFVETIIFWILSRGSILSCSFLLLMRDFFEVIQVFSLGLKLFFVVAPLWYSLALDYLI